MPVDATVQVRPLDRRTELGIRVDRPTPKAEEVEYPLAVLGRRDGADLEVIAECLERPPSRER
jgi:hypothetical protein